MVDPKLESVCNEKGLVDWIKSKMSKTYKKEEVITIIDKALSFLKSSFDVLNKSQDKYVNITWLKQGKPTELGGNNDKFTKEITGRLGESKTGNYIRVSLSIPKDDKEFSKDKISVESLKNAEYSVDLIIKGGSKGNSFVRPTGKLNLTNFKDGDLFKIAKQSFKSLNKYFKDELAESFVRTRLLEKRIARLENMLKHSYNE